MGIPEAIMGLPHPQPWLMFFLRFLLLSLLVWFLIFLTLFFSFLDLSF
jgi:hypothetical protein